MDDRKVRRATRLAVERGLARGDIDRDTAEEIVELLNDGQRAEAETRLFTAQTQR